MKKKIISAIVLIILALAAILPVLWYSNCFESFSPLYVLYEGKEVSGELCIEQRSANIQTRFDVKSAGFKPGAVDYSVRIIPNEENDFGYLCDGKMYLFSRAGDLTDYFDIELHEGYFILSAAIGQYNLINVLSAVRGSAVTLPDGVEDGKADYYTLEITGNGRTVNINFRFEVIAAEIGVDVPGGIIFGCVPYDIRFMSYGFTGDEEFDYTCRRSAFAGETVNFIATPINHDLVIAFAVIQSARNNEEIELITEVDGIFTFTMPKEDVVIKLYIVSEWN